MKKVNWILTGLGAIILSLYSNFASAQAAAPAAPTTLWNYLGIPQGANKISDSLLNRTGNRPNAERTNPLTRIADPANLDPSMPPSIQAAAKIKQQEDLAPQKIKAIKYLATVGCGCYQKMGVRDALVDSLDDCTEEVRYEAAKALAKVAGSCCDKCGNSCCNAKVMNKLKELADGTDDRCCQKETSERVRQAAREALNACKNKLPATNVTPLIPEPIPEHLKPEVPESDGGQHPLHPELPAPPSTEPTPAPVPDKKPLELPGDAPATVPLPLPANPPKAAYMPASRTNVEVRESAVTGPNLELRASVMKLFEQPTVDVQPAIAKPQSQPNANNEAVQTSASTAPGAPSQLRLVIGGDEPGYAVVQIHESSDSSSRPAK